MKKSTKLSILCGLTLCAVFYNAVEVFAEENIERFSLSEYVVAVTKMPIKNTDVQADVNVIDKEDIERMHYDTLDKALASVPGVQLTNYMGGMVNANIAKPIKINGSDRVIILVDGIRMTPMGSNTGAINPNLLNNMDNVERIEVLKGSAGVLYGSDAVGGVINIITKKGQENKTTIKSETGAFGKEHYFISNTGKLNGFSWNVYYDKDLKGNFKDGHGYEWENGFNSKVAGINLSKKFDEHHSVNIRYNQGKTYYNAEDPYDFNKKLNEYQKTRGRNDNQETIVEYQWNFDKDTSNKITYRNGRYFNYYQESSTMRPYLDWGACEGRGYISDTVNSQFSKNFDDKHVLIAGIEWNKVLYGRQTTNSSGIGFENPDSVDLDLNKEVKTWSYYVQDKWNITDKLNITGGLRYDEGKYATRKIGGEYGSEDKTSDLEGDFTKSITVGYKFDNRNDMYVSYDDYFVLPSADELSNVKEGVTLEPSTGKNYSIGYNHTIDDKTNISLNGFYRKADKWIALSGSPSDWYYENLNNAEDKGFNVQLNKRFDDRWSGFVGYSFLKHTSDVSDETDRLKTGILPRHTVNLGINYDYKKLNAGLTARGFLSRDDSGSSVNYDVSEGGWPNSHYWVVNLGINYQATKNIKLFAVGNNLLDVFYSEYAIYKDPWGWHEVHPGAVYAMPGRSFIVGMEYNF